MKTRDEYKNELLDVNTIDEIIKNYVKLDPAPPSSSVFAGIVKKYIKKGDDEIVSADERAEMGTTALFAASEAANQIVKKIEDAVVKYKSFYFLDSTIQIPIYQLLREAMIWKKLAEELYIETRINQDKVEKLESMQVFKNK